MEMDSRVGFERNQFASQVKNMPKSIIEEVECSLRGEETDDFYEGLLSGYANSFTMLKQMKPEGAELLIGLLTSILSRKMLKKTQEKS